MKIFICLFNIFWRFDAAGKLALRYIRIFLSSQIWMNYQLINSTITEMKHHDWWLSSAFDCVVTWAEPWFCSWGWISTHILHISLKIKEMEDVETFFSVIICVRDTSTSTHPSLPRIQMQLQETADSASSTSSPYKEMRPGWTLNTHTNTQCLPLQI